ncbi:F-actin-capping protein subunit beta [Myotisia sp. PD_48]|nr:F-actin-capping protein subunit beta [Myotisia sp. PD_48]
MENFSRHRRRVLKYNMKELIPFRQLHPLTRPILTLVALLYSIPTGSVSKHRRSELCSEILAWVLLPVLFYIMRRLEYNEIKGGIPIKSVLPPASSTTLWIVALAITSFSIFQAENGMVAFLPALTPLLLIAEKNIGSEPFDSPTSDSPYFSPFVNTIWGTVLAASFCIGTLTNWDLRGHFLSIIPVVALLVVYIILTPNIGLSTRFIPTFDIEAAIIPLSLRVVGLLVISLSVETFVFGFPRAQAIATLLLGFSKAMFWCLLAEITRNSSWRIAAAMKTFAIISVQDPFTLPSGTNALSHAIASFLCLGQVIYTPPRQKIYRPAFWAISLISVIPYLANNFAIDVARSSLVHSMEHPIESFIRHANADFDGVLQKQSQSYATAHQEYQRRYGLEPPRGFEAWYEFATKHQSPIIDEFDTLYDAVSPFLRLSGQDILDIMSAVQKRRKRDLWLCKFSSQQAKTRCRHPKRTADRHIQLLFNELLNDLGGVIPDIKFLVNHLDEPRVLISPGSLEGDSDASDRFNLTDISKRPVWDTLTKFCSLWEKEGVRDTNTMETFSLPFVTNPMSAMDLCQHPEYRAMHGLTISPGNFPLFEGAVPILSTGSLSSMGDILYPSPAYNESEFKYSDMHDIEWEKKQNNIYWAGSTTGGYAIDGMWPLYHRHRFVMLAQNLYRRQHSYLRERRGVVNLVKSSFLNTRLFDVAFARIFQCEPKQCRDQRATFRLRSWADKDRAFQSRLVFDTDGNGISGRYYKLLASKSAPLKQTLLREWHDDRLRPWVHYIPVSQSMEELPEMVLYLTSTGAGQRLARKIAMQGRDWFTKSFRDIDMTIYLYRLLLELARLQDPERPAS